MTRKESAEAAHFQAMYGGEESSLSPRMAEFLWTAAVVLGDLYSDEDMWPDLKKQLPGVVQRLSDGVWMARFKQCFDALADRLALGRSEPSCLAACTADEMALHLVIDFAESALDEGTITMDDTLPADADQDSDFNGAREVLFRDHDVLLLFDGSLDGVDDVDSDLSKRYRFANLHPKRWFLPFADVRFSNQRAASS